MSVVEIMLLPGGGSGDDELPPRMLLEQDGSWRQTGDKDVSFSLPQIRERFAEALESAVTGRAARDPVRELKAGARGLWHELIPREVGKALTDARAASEAPLLRVHMPPALEWIPWEVMWDGEDFLGIDFEIARAPIVPMPPGAPPASSREVRRVCSVLGRAIADPPNEHCFDSWVRTFPDVPGSHVELKPPGPGRARDWPTLVDLEADVEILHLTCHGARHEVWGHYWTLDPDDEGAGRHMYVLDSYSARSLIDSLSLAKPLVFGNACSPSATAPRAVGPEIPQLAPALIQSGAHNVVSSVATIGTELAMEFARVFYRCLLEERQPVATALRSTKRHFHTTRDWNGDPTYLFYCLYGPPATRYEPAPVTVSRS